jgi:hypothetical protein
MCNVVMCFYISSFCLAFAVDIAWCWLGGLAAQQGGLLRLHQGAAVGHLAVQQHGWSCMSVFSCVHISTPGLELVIHVPGAVVVAAQQGGQLLDHRVTQSGHPTDQRLRANSQLCVILRTRCVL